MFELMVKGRACTSPSNFSHDLMPFNYYFLNKFAHLQVSSLNKESTTVFKLAFGADTTWQFKWPWGNIWCGRRKTSCQGFSHFVLPMLGRGLINNTQLFSPYLSHLLFNWNCFSKGFMCHTWEIYSRLYKVTIYCKCHYSGRKIDQVT